MHGVLCGQEIRRHGMPRLMDGGHAQIPLQADAAALLRAGDHLEDGGFQSLHGDDGRIMTRGIQRSFVEKVCQIRAGKAAGGAGDHLQIHVLRKLLIPGVYL